MVKLTASTPHHLAFAGVGSRRAAVDYVVRAVEATGCATRDDFDIDGIVRVAHALHDDYQFDGIEPEIFWRIAAVFMR